ncbi:MAG TPA: radical SAM protein [Anaerolineales bacterium]|nr:radical SAM protein [Anaerolineales bacterium]
MNQFCSVPYIYTFEITAACNAHCAGCGNVFARTDLHITPQQCQAILSNVGSHIEMIRITGGEPTISPAFAEVIKLFDSLDKPIVVFTNGFWQHPQKVVENLSACQNLDGILVSLHGFSPASYRAFTGGDHFDQVLASIHTASQAGLTVNTNMILTRQNIDHLPEAVDLALKAGAQVVAFSRYYGLPIPGVTDLTPQQYQSAVQQALEFRRTGLPVKFNNNIPLCLGGELTQACPAGDTHCTISPACQVRLCNHSAYSVGDILTTPIGEIWASQAVQQWRLGVPAPCQSCQMYEYCRGGCRANAQANQVEVDPLACTPFETADPLPTIEHVLYAGARPRASFALRQEHFGYLLINRSQIFKVTAAALPLLNILQAGETTLADIERQFGKAAINFIGVLYDRRLVEI